jgi:ubiquinone/menaquinone biosynthesis C-methylase UbiE
MTDQAERYDRIAEGYEQWWAPVLAASARGLLDRVEPIVAAGATDVLDVGIGTGNLALPAIERWPAIRLTGIDASSEMAASAGRLADERLAPPDRARLTTHVAFAAELPFDAASFDLAISSFVFQLVPSRPKVLREMARVVRSGGVLAHVTWLADHSPFAPDRVFDTLLDEFGFEEEVGDDRHGDIATVAAAAGELRRAGFRDVTAEAALLEHAFTVDGYIGFLTEFDEASLFEDMARTERRRFLARLRERLMALPAEDLVFRAPIVYAMGRRGPR